MIQQPLAEPIASINERMPRVRPDNAIDRQAPVALKIRDGLPGCVSEYPGIIFLCGVSECAEPGPDIPNAFSPIALMKEPHEMNRCRIWC